MKQVSLIVAALLAGFVGGICGTLVVRTREQPRPAQVIRARRFELVDKAGKVISYWGIDKNQYAVLAFGSHWPVPPAGADRSHHPPGLEDPDNQRAAIGVIDDSPFLKFNGPDGGNRISMMLSLYDKPFLAMSDKSGRRVLLGVEASDTPGPQDNTWVLDFGPDSKARIGMFPAKTHGQEDFRGLFFLDNQKIEFPNKPAR